VRQARRLAIGGTTIALIAAAVFLWLRPAGGAGTPVLTLLAGGAPSATIGAGSPIFLEVFLHGTRNATGPSIGGRLRSWHRMIGIRVTQNGREVALPFVGVAAPRVRELATSSDGRPTVSDGESARAALDGMRRVFRIEVAAPPDSTRQLSAGSYQLVASLETPIWQFWGWRGRTESAPLVVTVVAQEPPSRQLAGNATFLYKTRQFDEAVRAAQEWAGRDAGSIRARILLGDALLATGDRDGARTAYHAALGLANATSSAERPVAILERLDRLRTATITRPR
jgi:hypothetical protein